MSGDSFDDRVARLEEHIVPDKETAADYLASAERNLAEGRPGSARLDLIIAKIKHELEDDELENDA